MCGRFTLQINMDELLERFQIGVPYESEEYRPRYNIAPTQQVLAVINDGKQNRLGHLRWGLIPSWAKDEKIGYKTFNARGETAAEKPSFRSAFKRRRCLVIADSFYEWVRDGSKKKTPYRIHLNHQPFAMAGLWEQWKNQKGEPVYSCTVLTTTPNDLMAEIHDRMPVILDRADEAAWLDPGNSDKEFLQNLIKPYPATEMAAYKVSTEVNRTKNNDHPGLIESI